MENKRYHVIKCNTMNRYKNTKLSLYHFIMILMNMKWNLEIRRIDFMRFPLNLFSQLTKTLMKFTQVFVNLRTKLREVFLDKFDYILFN